ELGVTLYDEDRMATDDDRERDAGEPRDGGGPEPGGVDDDRRVDAIARRGLDAGDAIARRTDRHHLDTLFDLHAPPSRGRGVAGGDSGRIAVARLRLVEDGAEMLDVDPRLDAGELPGLEHLGADTEQPLALDGFLELGTHRGGDPDHHTAFDVARLAADGVWKVLEHGQRPHDHLAGLRRGVELADDPDRPPGAAGSKELALEEEDVAHTNGRQMVGDGGAGDTAADGPGHDVVALSPEARDRLQGIETHGALRASVMLTVAVRVPLEPQRRDVCLLDRGFRDTTAGHADLDDSSTHESTSVPAVCASVDASSLDRPGASRSMARPRGIVPDAQRPARRIIRWTRASTTISPRWFRTRWRYVTMPRSGFFVSRLSATSTSTVSVSPSRTGAVTRSSPPRYAMPVPWMS